VFDAKAKARSWQVWASQHHGVLAAGGVAAALGGLAGRQVLSRR
jgi:hypothetical protein